MPTDTNEWGDVASNEWGDIAVADESPETAEEALSKKRSRLGLEREFASLDEGPISLRAVNAIVAPAVEAAAAFPANVINLPSLLTGGHPLVAPGQPIVHVPVESEDIERSIRESPILRGSILGANPELTAGVTRGALDVAEGFTTPEMAPLAGALPKAAPVVQRLVGTAFAGQMGSEVPEAASRFGEATVTGPPAEAFRQGTILAADIGFPAVIAGHAQPPPPAIVLPRSMAALSREPLQPFLPARVQPGARAGIPETPKPSVPIIPETVAEARETVIEAIRKADARTLNQIKALFPEARLSNEQARVFRNIAFPPVVESVRPQATIADVLGKPPEPPPEPGVSTVPKPPPAPTGGPSAIQIEGAEKPVPSVLAQPAVREGEVPTEIRAEGVREGAQAAPKPEVPLTDAVGNPPEFYSLPRLRALERSADPRIAAAKKYYGAKTVPDLARLAKARFDEMAAKAKPPDEPPLTPEEQVAAQRQLAEEVPAARAEETPASKGVYPTWATPELAAAIKRAQFQKPGEFKPFPEWEKASVEQQRLLLSSAFDFKRENGQIMIAPKASAEKRMGQIKFTELPAPEAPKPPEPGPGTGAGPGAAASGEFAPKTAVPVAIPAVNKRTVGEHIRLAVDKLFAKPQGKDTPIQTDVSTPLPDFQPHAKSKAIFSQPFGAERVPVLGAAVGGMRRLKGTVPESVVTYHAERNVGRSIASALAQEYSWIDEPFTIKDGQIVNIGRTKPDQSLFISDVFEALQRDPNAYDLSVTQRNVLDHLQALEADFQKLGEKYGLGKVMDNEGVLVDESFDAPTADAKTYFPRVVVEHPKTESLTRGASVGSKAFFEKPRMFDTEAEGWSKGYRYETSIAKRVATRAERLYKRIADKRLVDDPELGGITRKQLDAQLREAYAEELGAGEMTEARLAKIGDSIEAAGRVWQPAFFGKIFPRETANAMNKAFPNTQSTLRYAAASVNNALKGLWLGFDLGVGFIQGQGLMFYRPKVWAQANVNALKAMFSRSFFPEYMRRNLDPIREMAQLGSSVGRMEEMLAGLESGELLHRIPGVKQTVGRAITPFARQFQTFLDTAKVELWKGMREVTPREEWGRAIQSLESILTTSRMESVGVSATRALTERVLLIAPSYYRGALNLIAAIGERGVSGSVARRAIGSWLAGGAVLYYAVGKMLGMSDDDIRQRFDPRRSDFLMWRVKMGKRNTEVGFGGIFKSLMRLGGNAVKTSMEHPEDWKSLAPEKNPFTRWYRGHAGPVIGATWDIFTGKDFMGRDVGITPGELSQRLMPMTARAVLDPDQPLNPVDAGASFVGLTAFERRNEAQQELSRLASRFLEAQGRPRTQMERPAYDDPTYSNLRHALRTENTKRAAQVLTQLRRTRTDKQIESAMSDYVEYPFTGSADMERAFVATLNPDQRRQYLQAYRERTNELREFFKFFAKTPSKK